MKPYDLVKLYLRPRCIKQGKFVLSSGRESDFYVDCKPAITDPQILRAIAELMGLQLDLDQEDHYGFAAVPVGGVPIATALSLQEGFPLVLVRSEVKGYGTSRRVETCTIPQYKPKLIILEDVVTTGRSVLTTINTLVEEGFTPTKVLSIMDREEGGEKAILDVGMWYRSLFKRTDFV